MVHAHVSVFSSTAVSGSLWVYGDVVERTKVTTDTANLLHEDLVVETSLKFTLAGRGGGDVHSGLATSEDNKVFHRCDSGAVEGSVGGIGFQDGKIIDCDEL